MPESDGVLVDNVEFSYGKRLVLKNLSLAISPGVTGLLGPNGAGKSTLMNLIASLARPARGRITVGGYDLTDARARAAARAAIGYLPQRFSIAGGMSVRNHVEFAAWTQGVADDECATAAQRALGVVELVDLGDRRARTLSGGQRQRLGLACAIVHEPAVLLLDEPTVGLDPLQRLQVRKYLDVIGERSTVLISTHMVDDVALIADRVLVLAGGTIQFNGTAAELARPAESDLHISPLEAGYQDLVLATGAVDQ